jgi:hypothetical protein
MFTRLFVIPSSTQAQCDSASLIWSAAARRRFLSLECHRIVVEGVKLVHDGDKVIRTAEEVIPNRKDHSEK